MWASVSTAMQPNSSIGPEQVQHLGRALVGQVHLHFAARHRARPCCPSGPGSRRWPGPACGVRCAAPSTPAGSAPAATCNSRPARRNCGRPSSAAPPRLAHPGGQRLHARGADLLGRHVLQHHRGIARPGSPASTNSAVGRRLRPGPARPCAAGWPMPTCRMGLTCKSGRGPLTPTRQPGGVVLQHRDLPLCRSLLRCRPGCRPRAARSRKVSRFMPATSFFEPEAREVSPRFSS